jgi:hypothetical protein
VYIAKKLRDELYKVKDNFSGTMLYTDVINILTPVLKKFRAKPVLLLANGKKNDLFVGGCFDCYAKKLPIDIEITFSSKYDSIKLSKKRWEEFLFLIFHLVQHETIHLCQMSYRDDDDYSHYLCLDDFGEMTDNQTYLAELDELSAYASDLSHEILYNHPKLDPFVVLGSISNYNVSTYEYYKKVFSGKQWSAIKHKLLKNTYRWLGDAVKNNEGWYEK